MKDGGDGWGQSGEGTRAMHAPLAWTRAGSARSGALRQLRTREGSVAEPCC